MPLTLNIDPPHIAHLKDHARSLSISASRLITQYIDSLSPDETPPSLGTTIQALRKSQASLSKDGLLNIAIFGSVARGEEGPGSDVDLLVKVSSDMTAFRLARLKAEIQNILKTKVDLVTLDEYRKRFDRSIQKDVIVAY